MAKARIGQMIVKPSADSLIAAVDGETAGSKKRGPPPVHLWNPAFCGDIDMRVARDGTWFYQGTPIGRAPMVKLFASILKREGDAYFLVTPAEKVGITVDDLPLLAVDVDIAGEGQAQTLTFTTRTEDQVTAGADHEIVVTRDPGTGEPAPSIHVRRGLWARIDRKTFYRMIEAATHETIDGTHWFGLWSGGRFFAVIPSAELP